MKKTLLIIKKTSAILLSVLMLTMLTACKPDYDWPTEGPGSTLPAPDALKGEVDVSEFLGIFSANIKCSENDFRKYADKCRESGFNAEEFNDNGVFYLYHADGSSLTLYYTQKTMCISYHMPITLGNAVWPDNEAAKQVPKPESELFGKNPGENYKNERAFNVYAEIDSYDGFNEYIMRCKAAGFDNVLTNHPINFTADNGEYVITIAYVSLNVMSVMVSPV